MADDPTGTDWTDEELDLIVADYFQMIHEELAGRSYSKAERRGALLVHINRSKGSIEFKHQNISAVLQDLGLPWIKGYSLARTIKAPSWLRSKAIYPRDRSCWSRCPPCRRATN